MKKKQIKLNRKLFLKKETIATLDNKQQPKVVGGQSLACIRTRFTMCPATICID